MLAARPASAEPDAVRDGAIIVGSATAALLFNFVPLREQAPLRDHEWLRLDDRVRDNFSERGALLSHASLALTVGTASAFAIGTDDGAGDRALVLGESVALALAATSLTKVVVARPRPYTYSSDPRALRQRERAGRDAYRSMFSGHAAMSFAAVAAAGALVGGRDASTRERALVWGTGTLLAAATADLRVRAGRHFYSDVAIGGVIGGAIGTLVPALHDGEVYVPGGAEWAAIGGGLALGVLASELVPLGGGDGAHALQLAPLVMHGGGGVAIGGLL